MMKEIPLDGIAQKEVMRAALEKHGALTSRITLGIVMKQNDVKFASWSGISVPVVLFL